MLPQDPIILLSYVNTQLRDRDASLAAFCDRENADEADLRARLQEVGYIYDASIATATKCWASAMHRLTRSPGSSSIA